MGRHLYWIWQAFADLNIRRPSSGMGGPSYITFSEIEAYCGLKNIFLPGERQRLVKLVDILDKEWMRRHLEKLDRESGRSPSLPPASQSPPRHMPRQSTRKEVS